MYICTSEMRTNFINGLARKFKYALAFPTLSVEKREDIAYGAKYLYAYGTPFWTRGGQTHLNKIHLSKIERILKPYTDKIYDYFEDSVKSSTVYKTQKDFDDFHAELCELFLRSFANEGYIHTYGNAQKMTNVLFKYLACYADSSKYATAFRYCHMALDGYTYYSGYRFAFYRDGVYKAKYRVIARDLTAWSSLTNCDTTYEYDTIISDIRDYVSNNPKTYNEYLDICAVFPILTGIPRLCKEDDYVLTPFEAEFFLWEIAKACSTKDRSKKYIYPNTVIARVKSLV